VQGDPGTSGVALKHLSPSAAFLEEFARSALQTGRWNEVVPLQSIDISFDHVKQSRDLRFTYGLEFVHYKFRLFCFDQAMKLDSVFFSSSGFPVKNSIGAGLSFGSVDKHFRVWCSRLGFEIHDATT
jgi:hypothetical protein